jgi:hypothetical protein
MNKITHRIATHQPQQPQNYQYHSNGPQHLSLLPDGSFALPAAITIPAGSDNTINHKNSLWGEMVMIMQL